ncbi:YqgE/AlgH family protein [Brucellaceae bacterium C25G]
MISKAEDLQGGFLNGQFLLAMPNMVDERFARSVVYICAHSPEGAMGFIINQQQPIGFTDLLEQIGIIKEEDAIILPDHQRKLVIRNGGPVDKNRGFVLHSSDYSVSSTMPVAEDVSMTATVDILRAIYHDKGPRQAIMTLGYSGWESGQLEAELAHNGWLTCPATNTLLFDGEMSGKYERLLSEIGVDISRLVTSAGTA